MFVKSHEKPKIAVKINFKATCPENEVSDSDSEGLPPVMEVSGFFIQKTANSKVSYLPPIKGIYLFLND